MGVATARVRRWLRLLGGNLLVLLGILWTTNLCASAVLDVQYVVEPYVLPDDPRAEQPNYDDPERARAIYREIDLLRTRYMPFLVWSRLPVSGAHVTVDAAGDRVHRPGDASPVATVRFFGGSTMWGTGVSNDETIPARVQQLHPELAVFNHGETGFVSRQSLARLTNLVNEGAPMDVVVFYDGYNDVRSLCRFDTSLQGHKREERIRERVQPRHHVLHSLAGSTLRVLRSLVPARKPEGPPSRCHADPERPARVIRTLLSNWGHARAIAARGGARFVAILQPVAALSESETDDLKNDATFKGRAHELVYPALRDAVRAADAEWMIDLSRVFDRPGERIFVDAAHVSPNGNEILAREISDLLPPLLSRPDSP